MLNFVTDFADPAVLLPLGAVVALHLLAARWRRGGSAWVLCVAAVLAATVLAKLAGYAASGLWGTRLLRSPSGHVAASAMIYGSLGALCLRPAPGRMRMGLAWAAGIAGLVGASRIGVGAHTVPEVLVGGLLGMSGAWCFTALAGAAPDRVGRVRLALAAACIMAALHGRHLLFEPLIGHWAAEAVSAWQ